MVDEEQAETGSESETPRPSRSCRTAGIDRCIRALTAVLLVLAVVFFTLPFQTGPEGAGSATGLGSITEIGITPQGMQSFFAVITLCILVVWLFTCLAPGRAGALVRARLGEATLPYFALLASTGFEDGGYKTAVGPWLILALVVIAIIYSEVVCYRDPWRRAAVPSGHRKRFGPRAAKACLVVGSCLAVLALVLLVTGIVMGFHWTAALLIWPAYPAAMLSLLAFDLRHMALSATGERSRRTA